MKRSQQPTQLATRTRREPLSKRLNDARKSYREANLLWWAERRENASEGRLAAIDVVRRDAWAQCVRFNAKETF